MTRTDETQWLTRAQVAQRLQVPVKTLAAWASQGKGPAYSRFGRHVRYRLAEVIAWEESLTVAR